MRPLLRAGLLACVLAASALALPVHAAATSADLQVTTSTSPAASYAGTSGNLVLALKNAGDATATGLHLQVDAVDTGLEVDGTSAWLGSLSAGASSTVSPFGYSVAATVPPGFYHVGLRLDFQYDDGTTTQQGESLVTVTVTVRSPPSLLLGPLVPDELAPGATSHLNLTVTNVGSSDLSSIQLLWSNTGSTILPFGSSNALFLDHLAPGGAVQVPMTVAAASAATPGIYALVFASHYNDATGIRLNDTTTIGVRVGGETDFDLSAADASSQGSININVANIGVNAASSIVVAALVGPPGSQVPLASTFVGNLNPGDFTVATLSVPTGNATGGGGRTGGAGGSFTRGPGSGGGGGGGGGRGGFSGGRMTLRIGYTDSTGQRRSLDKEVLVPAARASTVTTAAPSGGLATSPLLWGAVVVVGGLIAWSAWRRRRDMAT